MNRRTDHIGMTDAAFIDIGKTSEASLQKNVRMHGRWRRGWQLGISVALEISGTILSSANCAFAQITPDATLGTESSIVTPNANVRGLPADLIQGGATRGANLFHSFDQFNVRNGQRVYFANPAGIENILSRVTGNNLSNILGTLGVDGGASLFLLNPNGIIFGQNAKLDIAGSFVASTANSLVFENGSKFSATNPEAPPLLTISITPGLQYGTTQPGATIANSGNLAVGQNLTLSADNLDLQGQLSAGGDLTLFAQDTVKVRDSVVSPFTASSGGKLLVQGTQGVDIFALNHPNSGFFSGGDMVLRSANTVGGDAHYWSGGSFRIEKLDGSLGNLFSPNDPIILTNGNVSLADYTGASLHILAGGSVTLGNVEITGTDSGENTINPNNPDPFLASLATVPLSDGTTLTIDGSAQSTLDVRAGIDWTTFPTGSPGNKTVGTVAPTPVFGGTTSANITVNGEIRVSLPDGVVLLTNQYRPNGLAGNILTQDIATSSVAGGNGGPITINSQGNITTGGLDSSSSSNSGNAGQGGEINLTAANGNIKTGELDSSSSSNSGNAGQGGAIRLTATNDINITGELNSESYSNSGNAGQGGAIRLTAVNNINITGNLYSLSESKNSNAGQGGEISLTAANGNINITGDLDSESYSEDGNAGQGGAIRLIATNDISITGNLYSFSSSDQGNAGQGGEISLIATNDINIAGDFYSFSYSDQGNAGRGGEISLRATGGDIIGNPSNPLLASFSLSEAGTAGRGGTVTLDARNKITNNITNLEILTLSSSDQAGDAMVAGSGDLSVTDTRILTSKQFLVQSRFLAPIYLDVGGKGQSGDVTVTSLGNLTFNNSSIQSDTKGSDPAGDVTISSPNLVSFINSQIISNTSSTGSAGSITLKASEVQLDPSSSVSAQTSSSGRAGNLTLQPYDRGQTLSVFFQNGAQISASTSGASKGGSIMVSAPESVTISGNGILSATADASSTGIAGDVFLTTPLLTITNGARVSASTNSLNASATGGNLTIQAEQLNLTGKSTIDAGTTGAAPGGDLNLNTGNLTVTDGAKVTVSSTGTGDAGNLNVNANNVFLDNGQLIAETASGEGGNINLNVEDLVLMRSNSQISAEARGTGNGGNMNINAGVAILAILSENSDIVANAYQGQGGNITASAPLIRTFRQFEKTRGRTPESDFIASSELGINGSVQFSTQTTIEESLPTNFVDQSEQIDRRCTPDAAKKRGSFTITGRGGIPPSPNDTLQAESIITPQWVSVDSEKKNNTPPAPTTPKSSAPRELAEAQGWIINEKGQVELIATAPQVTPQGTWLSPPECNPSQSSTMP